VNHREPGDIPALSSELQAKLYIYLDAEIARWARKAASLLNGLPTMNESEQSDARLEIAHAVGRIQAAVESRTKDLDTSPITRLRWRLDRIIHPPLSTDDPPWREIPISDRFRRRLHETRRGRRPSSPLDERGISPGL
jgi:hypothetical protein